MEPPAEFAAQYHADAVLMHLAREAFDLLLLYLDHHVQTLNAIQLHCVGSSSYLLSGAQSIVDTGSSCVDFSALNIKKGKEAPYSNAQCVKLTDRSIAFKFDIWRDAERAVKHPKLASPLPNGSGRFATKRALAHPRSNAQLPPSLFNSFHPNTSQPSRWLPARQSPARTARKLSRRSSLLARARGLLTRRRQRLQILHWYRHLGSRKTRLSPCRSSGPSKTIARFVEYTPARLRYLAIVLGGPLDRHGERRVFLEPKCPSRNLIRDSSLMLGPKAERLEALTLPPRRSVTALPSSRKMRRLARVPLDVFLDPNRESSSPDFDVDLRETDGQSQDTDQIHPFRASCQEDRLWSKTEPGYAKGDPKSGHLVALPKRWSQRVGAKLESNSTT
ncbi:hypothetical protein IWZ01DRAFT_487014 [Phyllosticta capitalensis]